MRRAPPQTHASVRLWLYKVPGLAYGDPLDLGTSFRVVVATIGWALVMYVSGLVVAVVFGFSELFLRTAPAFQVPALFAVCVIDVYWAASVLPLKADMVLDCMEDRTGATAGVAGIFGRVGSWRIAGTGALGMTALVIALVTAPDPAGVSESLIGSVFSPEWFNESSRGAKVFLAVLWAIPFGAVLLTGIHGLPQIWSTVNYLAGQRLIEYPLFVLPRVRQLVLFTQATAVAWGGPLAIAFVMTFGSTGVLVPVLVTAAALMGLWTLFAPHLVFHFSLERMVMSLTDRIRRDAATAMASKRPDDRLRALLQVSADPDLTWPYDLRSVLSFALGPLLPTALGVLSLLSRR